jgi:cell division protein FtsI/penicillin-binding protein 2
MQAHPCLFILTNLPQMVRAYTLFASEGNIVNPTLLYYSNEHENDLRVMSVEAASSVKKMLQLSSKANPNSTFANWDMSIASKSTLVKGMLTIKNETIEKVPEPDVAALIAILPANEPKYVVGILHEFPHNKGVDADVSASPVVAEMFTDFIIK